MEAHKQTILLKLRCWTHHTGVVAVEFLCFFQTKKRLCHRIGAEIRLEARAFPLKWISHPFFYGIWNSIIYWEFFWELEWNQLLNCVANEITRWKYIVTYEIQTGSKLQSQLPQKVLLYISSTFCTIRTRPFLPVKQGTNRSEYCAK